MTRRTFLFTAGLMAIAISISVVFSPEADVRKWRDWDINPIFQLFQFNRKKSFKLKFINNGCIKFNNKKQASYTVWLMDQHALHCFLKLSSIGFYNLNITSFRLFSIPIRSHCESVWINVLLFQAQNCILILNTCSVLAFNFALINIFHLFV